MKNYKEIYEQWLNDANIDEETKKELIKLKGNDKEIKERFYCDLTFGTGGLRGIMGAGTNRMNKYTIGKVTQGLANYISLKNGKEKGVVIAYDSRNNSKKFGEEVALILNANGIRTYIFESLRPTPELSFAVRNLNAIAGVVITASHNPPEYNGYKVYWEDGGQIVPPIDKEIIEQVNKIKDFKEIKKIKKDIAINNKLYNIIGEDIDEKYLNELKKLILNNNIIKEYGKNLKVVYTPLHGTGITLVPRLLKELGFTNLYIVEEQEKPDGNFPTVNYPNPEDSGAFELALKLAKEVDADIVLANDPDADRLGVYVKDNKSSTYRLFTGNMTALIIAQYLLKEKKKKNILLSDGVIIKTIVSSNMIKKIVEEYKVHLIEVLTGFKYIGQQIKLLEENHKYKFIFGYEESYGCLLGTYARDKDGIAAVMEICEIACYYKYYKLTLCDVMDNMYEKYGYYKEDLEFFTLRGTEGLKKIQLIMEELRNKDFNNIGEYEIKYKIDYLKSEKLQVSTGNIEKVDLPESNVLYYELNNDAWFCIRPSGTEPKIKVYIGVKGNNKDQAEYLLKNLKENILDLID